MMMAFQVPTLANQISTDAYSNAMQWHSTRVLQRPRMPSDKLKPARSFTVLVAVHRRTSS